MAETKAIRTNQEILRRVYTTDPTRLNQEDCRQLLYESEHVTNFSTPSFDRVTNKKAFNPANLNVITSCTATGVGVLQLSPSLGAAGDGAGQSEILFPSNVNNIFVEAHIVGSSGNIASIVSQAKTMTLAGSNLQGLSTYKLACTFTCVNHANTAIDCTLHIKVWTY